MHELLCVLLYLSLISSPNEYFDTEIYSIESDNQTLVDNVESNPTLYNYVLTEFDDEADWIEIWDASNY